MKLIIAIVNNDDYPKVQTALSNSGFGLTKLSTAGGFLKAGNATLLIGVEADRLDKAIGIIRENSARRTEMAAPTMSYFSEGIAPSAIPVSAGGATLFVIDVDRFMRF